MNLAVNSQLHLDIARILSLFPGIFCDCCFTTAPRPIMCFRTCYCRANYILKEDLHMAALALELCSTLMADRRLTPNVGVIVRNKVLPQALTLVRSSLLQGQALLALQSFFAALVYSANTSFDAILDSLLSTAKPSSQSSGVAKQALFSIAQCVVVLCLAVGDPKCSSIMKMLTAILKDDSTTDSDPCRPGVKDAVKLCTDWCKAAGTEATTTTIVAVYATSAASPFVAATIAAVETMASTTGCAVCGVKCPNGS